MTATKKIIVASLIGGVVVGGYAYRKGIDRLIFSLDGFESAPDGVNLMVRLRVWNPNRFFSYPVPRLIVNAFDNTGSFLGTIINQQWQSIPAGRESFIYGIVQPSWEGLVNLILGIIDSQSMPTGLIFDGEIQVWKINIPFDTSQSIPALGGPMDDCEEYPMIAGVEDLPEGVNIRIGTILNTSWGYEQTNIDFYKVVSIGKKFFTVEKLESISREVGSFMTTGEMPGESTGKTFRGSYRVWGSGEVSYKIEDHYARIWDGQEQQATHYA